MVYLRDVIERVSTHPARLDLGFTPREWQNSVAKPPPERGLGTRRLVCGVSLSSFAQDGRAYSSASSAFASMRSRLSKPPVKQA